MPETKKKLRPYKVDYIDITEINEKGKAPLHSTVVRAVSVADAKSLICVSALITTGTVDTTLIIHVERFYGKLSKRKVMHKLTKKELDMAAKLLALHQFEAPAPVEEAPVDEAPVSMADVHPESPEIHYLCCTEQDCVECEDYIKNIRPYVAPEMPEEVVAETQEGFEQIETGEGVTLPEEPLSEEPCNCECCTAVTQCENKVGYVPSEAVEVNYEANWDGLAWGDTDPIPVEEKSNKKLAYGTLIFMGVLVVAAVALYFHLH